MALYQTDDVLKIIKHEKISSIDNLQTTWRQYNNSIEHVGKKIGLFFKDIKMYRIK